jgi:hypothetical protein
MQFNCGIDAGLYKRSGGNIAKSNVTWSAQNAVNPHIMLCGVSGSGKTHQIRRIISELTSTAKHRIRVHVFNVHGDIDIPGSSNVLFSESSPYGLNPLTIDDDPHYGGVRKQIAQFLNIIQSTRSLGHKQEAVMRNLLTDLYAANHFYADKPTSWFLEDGISRKYAKRYPTLADLSRFAQYKLKHLYTGSNEKASSAFTALTKHIRKLHQQSTKSDADEEVSKSLRDKAINEYAHFILSVNTGNELDQFIRYDSKDVMKSVIDKIQNLENSGIFKNTAPAFDPHNPVWNYNIQPLNIEEQRMFIHFRLWQIFKNRKKRGVSNDVVELVVIDEAQNQIDDEDGNICNIIAAEGRKFGLSMLSASQSPKRFPDQFVTNCGTKIILGLDEADWDSSYRKLKVPIDALKWIKLHERALIQMKQKKEQRAEFKWCYFEPPK